MRRFAKTLQAVLIFLFFAAFSGGAVSAYAAASPVRPGLTGGEAASPGQPVLLPIIMYHSTADSGPPGNYNVTPAQFEKDIKYLIGKGYAPVAIADLINFKAGGELPAKPVMVTFDDGYMNNYYGVFPILQKHGFKCVMSVIGSLIDANYKKDGKPESTHSHVTYEQIREMAESGLVEIQNHTYGLHGTNKKTGRQGMKPRKGESRATYEKVLSDDLLKLNEKLKERAGVSCTAIAYPFGAYTDETVEIAEALGFKAGLTCREGINRLTRESSLMKLKRHNRPSGLSSEQFFKKHGI